jgi:UDP-N-acetylglucosamine:LPS N-acetylglucosamine transferase
MSGERVDSRARRVLLVSSSGGVLLDLLALEPWWREHERAWAVVRAIDAESLLNGERVRWIPDCSVAHPVGLVPGFLTAWRILRAERPTLVLSAGSGPAIPFFALSRVLGIPTFWLSSLNIVTTPGVAARICSRLASRILLQRESMRVAHPDGVVVGELY